VTIIANATPSLFAPVGLAFDASGGLWVANYTSNTVVRYDAAQLSSGSPTPAATITSGSFAGAGHPVGLAFDSSGALWVASKAAHDLRRFTNPSALSGSLTPTPDTIISSVPTTDAMLLAFSPPANGVPINTP